MYITHTVHVWNKRSVVNRSCKDHYTNNYTNIGVFTNAITMYVDLHPIYIPQGQNGGLETQIVIQVLYSRNNDDQSLYVLYTCSLYCTDFLHFWCHLRLYRMRLMSNVLWWYAKGTCVALCTIFPYLVLLRFVPGCNLRFHHQRIMVMMEKKVWQG